MEEYLTALRTLWSTAIFPLACWLAYSRPNSWWDVQRRRSIQQELLYIWWTPLLDESSPSCEPRKPRRRKATG